MTAAADRPTGGEAAPTVRPVDSGGGPLLRESFDDEADDGVLEVGATVWAVGGAGEAVSGSEPAVSLSLSSVS